MDKDTNAPTIPLSMEEKEEMPKPIVAEGEHADPSVELAIQELNEEGSKAFALQDYEKAIEKFSLASEMLGQLYGETSPKNADTLFMYGKALLEHAIQQSSVLGGATEKKSKSELQAVVDAATGTSSNAAGSSAAAAAKSSRFVFEGDEEEEDEEEEEEQEDGEENDEFEVAWDVLDLARVLYHRIGTEEALLKLGDVHIALGDVSLESENFEQAVSDYREAVKIKEARLDEDDRQLAEAHYKLALALEYSPSEAHLAQDHIHKASTVLRNRIQRLGGLLANTKGKSRATDASETETKMSKELVELHELLGEMEQKSQEVAANLANKANLDNLASLDEMLGASGSSKTDKNVGVVHDISNLIKPKPKTSANTASSNKVTATTTTSMTATTTTTTTTTSTSVTEETTQEVIASVTTEAETDSQSDLKRKLEDENSSKDDDNKKAKLQEE
ncbi:hypothetical protein BGW41_007139 [Actinomortierella wolfii]|nr:hypothetical protein BGW41_007139 [Actinomortierella wolfii]